MDKNSNKCFILLINMARNLCYFSIVLVIQHLIVGVTDGLPTGNPNAQTCVIGAGYSGLAAARYLKQYGVNFKVLEATRYVGGTWRFDPHVGFDQDGVPLFTRQYKNLRTNTPRQTMEYVGFSFPEDTPSYPAGTCFYEYLKAFAKHFELAKHIQFQSLITSVKWSNDSWKVTYTRTDTRNNETESCDYLIIATGQYRKPKMPKIKDQELFKGKVIHSCDYKEAEPFRNRRVLLVGAGASGLDLSTQLVNITSKLVHSHHLTYNQPNHPKTYIKKPDIKAFTSNGVMFQDDSFEEVEDVIFCTGYDLDFPFLDASSGVTVTPKFVLPLYQNIVNIRRPSMMFIAVPKGVINRVYDVQGEYIASLISGKFQLPSQEEMLKHWIKRVYHLQSQGKKIVDVNLIGNEMDQYFANLTQEANVTRAPQVLTDIRDFNAVYRLKDLLNYRDYDYKIIDDQHYERLYNPRKDLTCPVDNSK